ncbi:MAG: AAA family ATPase [Methylomonas sp.]|jgi:type II secretory pathway predicted ATPase ExeA
MYKEFFGFNKKPFSLIPDPDFLFLSPKHKKAWSVLQYGLISQAGFTVITGEIGAGKTTLIRKALLTMSDECVVGLITNTHIAFGDLLTWVLNSFNIPHTAPDKVGRYQIFVDFLNQQHAINKRAILVVDEAQNMDLQSLEELRLLSNINVSQDMLLQLVLVGQPELIDKLNSPELVQFAQRISIEYHLEPLSEAETIQYIHHRLKVVGGDESIFDDVVCVAVYHFSGGVPRLINNICDLALVYAFGEGEKVVTLNNVMEVINERKTGKIIASHKK